MNKLVERIEKLKPFFEKLSRNIYLRPIRDGFIAGMPVVLFSSIFILIAFVPNAFGIFWSDKTVEMLMKPYNYSMGILGFLVAGTTAKSFTDMVNRTMDKTKQINFMSTMLAAMIGFLILSADPAAEGGFLSSFMGTKGLITAFISAFVTVNIYKVCMRNDVTIKMPKEVPPNISRVFTDLIPFSLVIVILYAVDIIVRNISGNSVAESISLGLAPLFQAADGYLGLTLIFGAYAFFWFVGIHGPSIVEPAIAAVLYSNAEINLGLMQAGQHADKVITSGTQMFIVTLGGTGATLVVPFMFMLLAKSKRNKVVGRASVVPTFFGINEPILFGAPIVLNPVFFVPFILAPIVNVWIFKFFVDTLGMNIFTANLPWTTPAPLGMLLGLNFQGLAIVLIFVLLIVDTIIYYPFFRVYDEYDEERLPRLIELESGLRLKEKGADGIKVLLYYDVDDREETNEKKKAWVERVGYECEALGLPYFLEILTYDAKMESEKTPEYAKIRPRKVIEATREFSDPRYLVDVLKLETPVDMNHLEGFGQKESLYSKEEALKYFKDQSDATDLPYIYLSGGISAELFQDMLRIAKESGAKFNGVLCGRATWVDSVDIYGKDQEEAAKWLDETGKDNITSLNEVLKETAYSIFDKIEEA